MIDLIKRMKNRLNLTIISKEVNSMPMYRLNIHYKEEDLQMIARAHITIAAVKHTANDCLESRMGDGPHGTSAS